MKQGIFAGWRQAAIGLVLLAITAMIATTYSVIALPFGAQFHLPRKELMLAMTVLSGASAAMSPLLGRVMERVAIRKLMLFGALLIAAGYFLLSYVTAFSQALLAYGLLIAPANVLLGPVAVTVLLSRWFVAQRGRAIGIAITGVAVGAFVFPPLLQFLIDHFEWRPALRLLAVIVLAICLPAIALVVERPEVLGLHPDGAAEPAAVAGEDQPKVVPSAMTILSDPSFWIIVLMSAVISSGLKGLSTNLVLLVTDLGLTAASGAALLSLYAVFAFAAKLSFALISDKVSSRALIAISLIGFALGNLGMAFIHSGYWVVAVMVGTIGFFGGIMTPMQAFLMPRIFGRDYVGRAYGLLSGVTMIALLASPVFFGWMFDAMGNYDRVFLTYAVLALIALAFAPFVRLHPRATFGGD